MRIGIDAREAFSATPTGKGMWSARVIEELVKRGRELTLFLKEDFAEHLGKSRERGGAPMLCAKCSVARTFRGSMRWHFNVARHLRRQENTELYLSPTSYLVPWLLGKRFPSAIVIHDLIAFHDEPHDRKAKYLERVMLPRVLRTATHIFTVSEATKAELLERFPKTDPQKVTVVYEGLTTNLACHAERSGAESKHIASVDAPYILMIGTLCPRKNQLRLIEAFNLLPADLRKNAKLLLVGKRGWQDEEIVKLARTSHNVEWRGYVAAAERDELLRNATVFAYPSLMEGFGLPVLDALSLGIPTLTSERSSLPEVAGDAALFIDPENVDAIAEGLRRLLTEENLRKRLSEEGPRQASKFSWKRTVDLLLAAIDVSP